MTRLPLLAGRLFEPGDGPANVVIPESYARRFWPDGNAVGGTIRGGEQTWFKDTMTVVGVVGDFRRAATSMAGADDSLFAYYLHTPPPPEAGSGPTDPQRFVDSGGSYSILTVSVRVASAEALPAVRAAVQRMDSRLAVTLTLVDERYRQLNANVRLAAQTVGIFSVVSFAIAMAGLYGVIAFVVTSRTREIGIRIALGATAAGIRRLVLTAAAGMVGLGVVAGVALAFGSARWIDVDSVGAPRPAPPRRLRTAPRAV